MNIPPPPKWDKTIDSVENGYKWAADYERSLLPKGILFPKKDQVWEAVAECETSYVGLSPESFLPWGGTVRLNRGTLVRIINQEEQPVDVQFKPVHAEAMLEEIVPAHMRDRMGELDYWLTMPLASTPCRFRQETAFFSELFKLSVEST